MSTAYLTRFQINPHRRGAARLLASPQRLHAAVLASFPPDLIAKATGRRVLWRLDAPSNVERNLFVVGPGRMSPEVLREQAGWSEQKTWDTADYEPFLQRLRIGQRWTFRLTANPTEARATTHGERGRVRAHVTADQQQTWLLSRSARYGFTIVSDGGAPLLRVTRRERDSFDKGRDTVKRRVTVSRAQFDGVLEVTDDELLRSALLTGIGRAKAYGCGLMTLAPLR